MLLSKANSLFLLRDALALVLRLHVIHPSVRLSVSLSVTLMDQDHIGWKMEILETNCTGN